MKQEPEESGSCDNCDKHSNIFDQADQFEHDQVVPKEHSQLHEASLRTSPPGVLDQHDQYGHVSKAKVVAKEQLQHHEASFRTSTSGVSDQRHFIADLNEACDSVCEQASDQTCLNVERDKAFDLVNQCNSEIKNLISRLTLHMQQLKCNAHAITTVKTESNTSSEGVSKKGRFVSEVVATTQQVRLATAVYPTASLMNHSCEPNVIARYVYKLITIIKF